MVIGMNCKESRFYFYFQEKTIECEIQELSDVIITTYGGRFASHLWKEYILSVT
jgi:hypothetical protein